MKCSPNSPATRHHMNDIQRNFERQMAQRECNRSHRLSVTETDDAVIISIDMPGVDENDVTATIHDEHLVIEGKRLANHDSEATVVHNERVFGDFRRVVRLDDSIDPDSVDGVLQNGVLTLTLKRREEVQPKKIDIRSAK